MNQTVFGVGIDTARYGHHVSFLDQQQRTAFACFHFKEEAAGFDKLKKVLVNLAKKNPEAEIRIHLDPASNPQISSLQLGERRLGNGVLNR